MAATGRPAVARAEGRATAATLRAAGMNVDLAPVVDVVRPESALHAEGRGFGFSAAQRRALRRGLHARAARRRRGRHGQALPRLRRGAAPTPISARCASASGCASCAQSTALPFAAAVRAGAGLVMLSSAIYPALSRAPAVLSPRVVQRELRDGLGFGGVTISDDLEAPAFAPHGGATRRGAAAPRARASTCCSSRAPTTGPTARRGRWPRALRSGRVDRGALEASLARVLALRAALP